MTNPMDDLMNGNQSVIDSQRQREMETDLQLAQMAQVTADSLSDFAPDIGDMTEGDVILPIDGSTSTVPTDTGFTGQFLVRNGFSFGGIVYQFGSVIAGVLGWGANREGQGLFGAGAGVFDLLGIRIIGSTSESNVRSYQFVDAITPTKFWGGLYQFLTASVNTIRLKALSTAGNESFVHIESIAPSAKQARVLLEVDDTSGTTAKVNLTSTSGAATLTLEDIENVNLVATDVLALDAPNVQTDSDNEINQTAGTNIRSQAGAGSEISFNDAQNTSNLRAASDTDANALFVNGTSGKTGLGTNAPDEKLHVVGNAKVTGDVTAANIVAGTYTPTLTNTTNVAASTASAAQYMRVGNTVTVSGRVAIDPTAAGAVVLEMSLPIASNLGAANNLGGVAASGAVAGLCAAIEGSAANDTALFSWVAVDVANRAFSFTFSYRVI